jgi:hypothetical protein
MFALRKGVSESPKKREKPSISGVVKFNYSQIMPYCLKNNRTLEGWADLGKMFQICKRCVEVWHEHCATEGPSRFKVVERNE